MTLTAIQKEIVKDAIREGYFLCAAEDEWAAIVAVESGLADYRAGHLTFFKPHDDPAKNADRRRVIKAIGSF